MIVRQAISQPATYLECAKELFYIKSQLTVRQVARQVLLDIFEQLLWKVTLITWSGLFTFRTCVQPMMAAIFIHMMVLIPIACSLRIALNNLKNSARAV